MACRGRYENTQPDWNRSSHHRCKRAAGNLHGTFGTKPRICKVTGDSGISKIPILTITLTYITIHGSRSYPLQHSFSNLLIQYWCIASMIIIVITFLIPHSPCAEFSRNHMYCAKPSQNSMVHHGEREQTQNLIFTLHYSCPWRRELSYGLWMPLAATTFHISCHLEDFLDIHQKCMQILQNNTTPRFVWIMVWKRFFIIPR